MTLYFQWALEPAKWSILSRTLPDIFQVTPRCNTSIDDTQLTISALGLSLIDLNRLRIIVIFPEELVELLFSFTMRYLLLSDISDEALSAIIDHLSRVSDVEERAAMIINTANISNIAIFADMPTNSIEELCIPQFSFPEIITPGAHRSSGVTWHDISKITERNIIERLGFTTRGIKAIEYLWQLKKRAHDLLAILSRGIPLEEYVDFERLVDAFTRTITEKERYRTVLKGRLGFLDGRKWTLEELGECENLTRERIRQIEQKLMTIFQKRQASNQLIRLWYALDEVLTAGGGVCFVAEIAEFLRHRWNWSTLPSEESIASLISLSTKCIWSSPISIIMPTHKCVNCTKIRQFLPKAIENQPNGILSFEAANNVMKEFCLSKACDVTSEITQFSNGYFHFLEDSMEEIIADETALYTQSAWAQKYGKSRVLLVETILRNAGRPLHFTEVHAEINKDRPSNGQLSERNVYSYIGRSPDLLLWDRGTYVHRDNISIPFELIAHIEGEIIIKLRSGIPYLSVSGIFELFSAILQKSGVSSESGLYSCLRESNNEALVYQEYPYILLRDKTYQRLPVPLVIEKFIIDQECVVKYDDIRKYAVEVLCINEALFAPTYFPKIPNLLRINRGEYIHFRQLEVEIENLTPIIDHAVSLLNISDHVSVSKVFNDKKVTCKLLGISTPILLFSILQFFYSEQFDLSRYPRIRLNAGGPIIDRGSIYSEFITFIRDKGVPCNVAEVYQYFVESLGYNQTSVYNAFYDKRILRYSESVIVHIELLGWTEGKQKALEKLAVSHLIERQSTGKLFGLISHLYEYGHDKLPEIPTPISWTPTLVGELLVREGKFRIIGTQRNAFVSIPNSNSIDNLDDLLYHILMEDKYDGAASIDQFISDMRGAGILSKRLTPMMLGSDSRVVINGSVVQLARLQAC